MATDFIYSCVHTFAMHHHSSSHQEVETASLLFESVECVACLGQWNAVSCDTSKGLKSICALRLALLRLLETMRGPSMSVG